MLAKTPVSAGKFTVRRRGLALLLLGALSLTAFTALAGAGDEDEALLPGQSRERPIAGGETQRYRVQVTDAPLLVTVEQRGIDLVVEAQGPAARLAADAGYLRWQSEVLLLESAGEHRLEIHSREAAVPPARYAIRVEVLQASDGRRKALALMSRAGQEAFPRTPEARRRAIATYREALAQWSALEDRRWEAETLDALAELEYEERELQPAAEDCLRALPIWRELHEPRREAADLNELGVIHLYKQEKDAAGEALRSALSLWQRLEERFDEVETRGNLCFLQHLRGDLPAALGCLQEALLLYRELGDQANEATTLNNIGGVYDGLGQPEAALDSYAKALALRSKLTDRRAEAETLNNIAKVHRALGEWQEALRVYGQVRGILTPLGDRSLMGVVLNNLAVTYNSLGEPERARSFLEDSLELRRTLHDRPGEIVTLYNLAEAWRNLGDASKALDHYRRALDLAKELGDHRLEASNRLGLGEVQLGRGDGAAALREIEPALAALREMRSRRGEVMALQLQGRALAVAGRPREALPVLQDALARLRDLGDRAGEAEALQALAAAERSLGLAAAARGHAEEAIARVEELRGGFVSPGLRAAFLATQRRAYSLLIDLLMDQHAAHPEAGHDRTALQVSEQARARSLLDALYSGGTVRSGSGVPAELLEQRRSLRYRLSLKTDQQLTKGGTGGERSEAQAREIDSLLAGLDGVEAEIRRLDPLYAAVSAPRSFGVEDVARLLDADTLLLEYSLGEERSVLWAIGTGFFRSYILPSQRKIEALARPLYDELSTLEAGSGGRKDAAAAVSRVLLGEVWPEASRYRRLVIVPDAALHLLPFNALPAPGSGQPLLEQLEVDYLPSATTLALQRQRLEHRPQAAKWAAVFADPVFAPNDTRLKVGEQPGRERGVPEDAFPQGFERLPATRREAEGIAALAPAGQVWMARDLEASRESVLSGKLRDYRVVHFATHGLADTRHPELSGLVFSRVDAAGRPREGFLSLSDVYELDLNADLAVLSGCRTALGKEVRGEGIMGLTRGFLYAGVPRVVASLWRVQDRATAELMPRFYRALWQDHLPAAAALREAQRSLRHDPHNPKFRDPYFWAGFVLQGDWR